jgi:signal transduction histidine kinase
MASADNMRNLIENLLEFSRVSRNQQPMETTSLAEVLSEVLSELDMAIEEAGATVKAETLPTLQASPSQMAQLFHNLISNALKFRKKDVAPVITIAARNLTREEKKQHQLQSAAEYVMITVSDNGIGFEEKFADKIFQLFQRLHGKYEYPGTGIGLSICKKIVTNHHGIMYASGEPGIGSVFYIILPIQ